MPEKVQAVLFFDLDGTLLNNQHQVEEEIIFAIQEMKTRGILPIIATGRSVSAVEDIMAYSGIDSIVAMNGQYIEIAGKEIYSEKIPIPLLDRFIQFSQEQQIALSLYNAHRFWATSHSEVMKKGYRMIHSPLPEILPKEHHHEDVHMILALTDNLAHDKLYQEQFREFSFYRNVPMAIDIVKKGIDKKSGITHLLHYLGHQEIPTYAFGDGPNDVTLLQAVTHGIAMGNAVAETKAAAEFITRSNTDGGILHALRHYGLIH